MRTWAWPIAVAASALACGSFVPEVGELRMTIEAGAEAAPAPQTVTVTVGPRGDHVYRPASVTIREGDTIRWTWESSGHSVVSGPRGSPDGLFCSPGGTSCASTPESNAGAIYEHRFPVRGTFPYGCAQHGDMRGTIVVE